MYIRMVSLIVNSVVSLGFSYVINVTFNQLDKKLLLLYPLHAFPFKNGLRNALMDVKIERQKKKILLSRTDVV